MRYKICVIIIWFCLQEAKAQDLKYPETLKVEQTDVYHGTSVSDPYRWLEDDQSKETATWVKTQNTLTFSYLQKIGFRDKVKSRMTALWNFPRQSAATWQHGYYYYYKNNGMQNQAVLYRKNGLKGIEELVIDPNLMSKDGTTSLKLFEVSNDGKYAAYGISKAGSDWTEIRIIETSTGREISEVLNWVKFSNIAWENDGFYYSRYDAPTEGSALSGKNEFHKIYYHKIGTPQSNDQLIFEDTKNALMNFSATVSSD